MSDPHDTAISLATAKEMFEAGMSLRDVGRAVGASRETIRRWAIKHDWTVPERIIGADGRPKPIPTTEELEAARLRAEKAAQTARTRWSVLRSEEADAAGLAAQGVRTKIMELVNADKASDARQLASVYATLIDRANALAAEPTARGRQGDEDGPSVHGPRPTDPREMAAAGRQRALQLVPAVDVVSRETSG